MRRADVDEVSRLAADVAALCKKLTAEADAPHKVWRRDEGMVTVPGKKGSPPQPGMTAAELRRRSMDLTRALARLRRRGDHG